MRPILRRGIVDLFSSRLAVIRMSRQQLFIPNEPIDSSTIPPDLQSWHEMDHGRRKEKDGSTQTTVFGIELIEAVPRECGTHLFLSFEALLFGGAINEHYVENWLMKKLDTFPYPKGLVSEADVTEAIIGLVRKYWMSRRLTFWLPFLVLLGVPSHFHVVAWCIATIWMNCILMIWFVCMWNLRIA